MWAKLHRLVLDELGSRGELDWSRCAIDSVSVRALKGGSWRDRIRPAAARGDRKSTSSSTARACHCRSASPPATCTTARPSPHWSVASRPSAPVAARGAGDPGSYTVTRATTTATCGDGSPPAASDTVSPARASSHPGTWAGTAGSWSGPCPGCPAAAASTAATSASRNASSPSAPSPPPSYVIISEYDVISVGQPAVAVCSHRGGNRRANATLFRVILTRIRCRPEKLAHVQRRTAEVCMKQEIIRCLTDVGALRVGWDGPAVCRQGRNGGSAISGVRSRTARRRARNRPRPRPVRCGRGR